MQISRELLALLMVATVSVSAKADLLTYDLTGELTGTLNDATGSAIDTFANAPFAWQATVDTATALIDTTHGGLTLEVPAITDTVTVGSLLLSPTIPTYFAFESAAPPIVPSARGIGGFVDMTALMGIAFNSPNLFTYDGLSPLAPLAVNFDNAGPLPTDGGTLSITGAVDLVFAVPEPSTLLASIAGLAGMVYIGRSTRRLSRPLSAETGTVSS